MNIDLLVKYFESWAPKDIAWEKDNIGIQVGNPKNRITNVLLALELDEKVLEQAIKKKCNLIFTHHPFIFNPINNLNFSNSKKSQLIEKLISEKITLYSAHTNLDYTKNGVSFELAKLLGLQNIEFLENQSSNQFKLVVYVPETNITEVADKIFEAGGGVIGEYSKCSSRSTVEGTFEGSKNSNPKVGVKNSFVKVPEIKLEVLVNSWELNSIIEAMKLIHPYEEPAYDVYPLRNKNLNFGAGAIGELTTQLNVSKFLKLVSSKLKADSFRYTKGKTNRIKRVAVCGGSCAEMFEKAISADADAFVTADVKYHTFQDAENKILLIDAGHYETEVPVLNRVKTYLEKFIKDHNSDIKIFKYTGSTNPVKFYNKKGVIND